VLLVGVDMIHRLTDPNDPGCFLWSDGAGAAVLEGGNEAGFIGAAFQSDGAYAAGWGILAGGTFEPANVDAVKDRRTMMRREAGNYPASVNEDSWPRLFRRLSTECGFTADQVDQLIFTQISKHVAFQTARAAYSLLCERRRLSSRRLVTRLCPIAVRPLRWTSSRGKRLP